MALSQNNNVQSHCNIRKEASGMTVSEFRNSKKTSLDAVIHAWLEVLCEKLCEQSIASAEEKLANTKSSVVMVETHASPAELQVASSSHFPLNHTLEDLIESTWQRGEASIHSQFGRGAYVYSATIRFQVKN